MLRAASKSSHAASALTRLATLAPLSRKGRGLSPSFACNPPPLQGKVPDEGGRVRGRLSYNTDFDATVEECLTLLLKGYNNMKAYFIDTDLQ